jgi:bifunctional non-homologous end joining protein LigD
VHVARRVRRRRLHAPKGSRAGFGALLLGAFDGDALATPAASAPASTTAELRRLHAACGDRAADVAVRRGPARVRDATWVEPELVVEVAFTERTRDGRLRHPTFRGLREDKPAAEVSWPPADAAAGGVATGGSARRRGGRDTGAAGERRRREPRRRPRRQPAPEAPLGPRAQGRRRGRRRPAQQRRPGPLPAQGITKLDLAEYYVAIEAHVLPGMVERPLALVRCPQGRAKQCFYQKHPGDAFPRDLPLVPIEESGTNDYAYVRDDRRPGGPGAGRRARGPRVGGRIDDVERPDLMVIDLDPWPDVPWAVTRARPRSTLRARLDDLGLAGFLRTTGGKGLHVVVPLRSGATAGTR